MTAYTYEHKTRLAKQFAERWKNETREEAEAKTFWDEFFRIFNLDRYKTATLEYGIKHHKQKTTKFADVFWTGKLLCEHKSARKDLDAAYEQAAGYVDEIRRHDSNDVPRYLIVCDFATMRLYDLQGGSRIDFPLEALPEQIRLKNFDFMDGIERELKAAEEKANIDAANAVGAVYRAFAQDPGYNAHQLKQFIIRLLFCFFADDTDIFNKDQFEDYLLKFAATPDRIGAAVNAVFKVLNTPEDKRPAHMPAELKAFPYVNGGLFAEALDEFYFDDNTHALLLACCRTDWAQISPEIFGSLFQSVMDSAERREAGAHYTEEANIRKVIDSLFMDGLRQEFDSLRQMKSGNKSALEKRQNALEQFHEKIGRLTFLDPACGCGNFLVVAYRELRRLEDDIIAAQHGERVQLLDIQTMQKLHLTQFQGIEIDEYPAQIAKTAMWLTDHQCNRATADRFGQTRPTIPLTDSAHILHANSLQTEWPAAGYIFGNPPFVGSTYQSKEQKADTQAISGRLKNAGILDYVANWYVKAAGIMQQHPHVQTAFVSTNSITQGQQVEALWGALLNEGMEIFFAHRTFQWTSQAHGKAAVHCVIVGFRPAAAHSGEKYLFDYSDIKGLPEKRLCRNISPYLMDAPTLIIGKRSKPVSGEMEMRSGGKPTEGGHLILTTAEKNELVAAEPLAEQYIRPFSMGNEFLNNIERWCLWFHGVSEIRLFNDLKHMPKVVQRIEAVKQMRLESGKLATQKKAATPHLFDEIKQPESGHYLAIPKVSSETRQFIPIGFLDYQLIAGDKLFMLPNATLYHFGLLCSTMHNAFMRTVAGRLKSDYSYSNTIVYNNFPFPFAAAHLQESPPSAAEQKHRAAIEAAAQAVLDARAHYAAQAQAENLPAPSLADLYRPNAPFSRLHQAHAALDKAVDAAYGYTGSPDDAERVAFLFAKIQAA